MSKCALLGCSRTSVRNQQGSPTLRPEELSSMQISAPTPIKHTWILNFIKAVRQRRHQKAAPEHTAQTTAEGKLIKAFCACVRGVSCLYQQLSIVYMRHSKGETKTKIYEINTDIRNLNKSALAYHFEYQWRWEFILIILSGSCCYKNICILEWLGKIT